MKKPITFWVYPNRSTQLWAFRVLLYHTHASVVRNYRDVGRGRGKDPIAFCRCFKNPVEWVSGPNAGKKDKGFLGELIFSLDRLDMGTIAHECLHAGLHYCVKTKKINFKFKSWGRQASHHEEVLCHASGDMVNQIVNKMIEEGLNE